MINLHVSLTSVSARFFHLFLLILIFNFYSPSYSAGQTIYDYALELDSLYKELKATDETAAEPFFEVFRKVADLGPYYPVKKIEDNLYQLQLRNEGAYALKLYDLSKRLEADSVSIFKSQRDSLADIVYSLLNITQAEIERNISAGWGFEDLIEDKRDLSSMPDSIYKRVIILMIKVDDIDDKIEKYKGRNSGDSGLSQKEEALDAIPIGVENGSAAAAPIIIQNQVGGSAQSAIIDGTAKWIAERMRQELSMAFFDRFETWAENKNITLLFPNTISVLKSSATTDYTLMMEIYKRAFQNDLQQLTFNIPTFLENEMIDEEENLLFLNQIAQLNFEIGKRDHINRFNGIYSRDSTNLALIEQKESYQNQLDRKQFIKYLNLSLQTINQLQEGQHPSSLINTLHTESNELFPQNDQLQSILLLLNLISQSLTATNEEKNTVWMGKEVINQLKSNAQLRKFYFGLLVLKVQTEIGKQQQRQSVLTNNAIPQDQRKVLTDKISYIDSLYGAFQVFLGGSMPYDTINFVLDDINTISFLDKYFNENVHSTSGLQLSRKQAKSYLSLFKDSPYYKFLAYADQLKKEDERLRMLIEEYFSSRADLIVSDHVRYFYVAPNPVDFYYHCQYERSFEAAKAAYFDRMGYRNAKQYLILPQYKTEDYLPLIDSINNIRLKNRFDFYEKYFKNWDENHPDNLRRNFKLIDKNNILKKDSLNYLYQMDIDNSAFLKGNLRMHQLSKQQEFLEFFIGGGYRTGVPQVSHHFNSFVQYATKIDQINAQFKELRSNGQANFGNQEFIYLIKNSMGVLDLIFDHTVDKSNPTMVRNMETIQFAMDNLLNAYIAGLSEDYNGVITYIIPVVEKLITNKYDKLILPLEAEARATASEDQLSMGLLPRSAALDSLRLLRDDKLRKMQEVFKYCTFIAAVAKSNGSDDVKKAINAIALPIGSYSIKRRTYANISLNAYPGITGGFELVQNDNFSEWAPNFGFTAPIGIGINWGYRTKINERRYRKSLNYRNRVQKAEVGVDDRIFNGHSGSFFFSFVDLGALVLFRLNDSNEPLPEDVGLKQIFSPGVAYVHGLPRVPISIMAGAQLTPDLRKVGEGENIESANSFRFNVSIVVDLPIANFHTRRRPKR